MSLDSGCWYCTHEQLGQSLAGYAASGMVDADEVMLLLRASFWLKFANAEVFFRGGGSQAEVINLAAAMSSRARAARTNASAGPLPA